MKIPPQYNRLMPYLIVEGAYQFKKFMTEVFDAEELHLTERSEGVIMHGELKIGEGVIMYADKTDQFEAKPAGIFIYVANTDETYQKALKAGASSLMEPVNQPYGYTCGFRDPFGNDWWPVQAES